MSAPSRQYIAVIGMSCRLPRAATVDQFWRNLRDGVDCMSRFSDEELLAAGTGRDALAHPGIVKTRGALDDIEWFDAAFFGMTADEAEITDPQHRIFLECAWEALEDAGYDPERFPGRIGVFAGMATSSYLKNVLLNRRTAATASPVQVAIGNDKDHLCTRVSYKLNLRGPSITVQTASSTSLVAVSVACQSLLDQECDIALAGGVSISATQRAAYFTDESGLSSPDGRCRAFDARANGTVDGSGAGIVVLKRLEDSVDDGDRVCAVIRGWALNNDGSAKVGYTAPSVQGQTQVVIEAQAMADVDPDSISYVEGHGSGTALGDTIEVEALTSAFQWRSARRGYCALGSVKTNIGHLAVAAGIAGLLKTVLSIERGWIPASLNFERPNPSISPESSPFYVNGRLSRWACNGPRRAGVSSFGFGGTNVHVVLEEPPPPAPRDDRPGPHLLVLSARTPSALRAASTNLAERLRRDRPPLVDVAYTLALGRRQFPVRRALVAATVDEAIARLESEDGSWTREPLSFVRPICLLLPGAGMLHSRIPKGLWEHDAAFRRDIVACAAAFGPYGHGDLMKTHEAGHHRPVLEEAACFSVSYALARAWMRRGIRPAALLGYGLGEIVAATLSEVFSLDAAVRLVAERGRLMEPQPAVVTLDVPLAADVVFPLLPLEAEIVASNSPQSCLVAGPEAVMAFLETRLRARGAAPRGVNVSHTLRSPAAVRAFVDVVRSIVCREPQIPFVSNVTGRWISTRDAIDPEYWGRHLSAPIRFADGIRTLKQQGNPLPIEIGRGSPLGAYVDETLGSTATLRVDPASDGNDGFGPYLDLVGRAWTCGGEIEWELHFADVLPHRVSLPSYPFERQKYWVEPAAELKLLYREQLAHSGVDK